MSHEINETIDTVYTPDNEAFRDTWHGLQTTVEGEIALDGSNVPLVFDPIIEIGLNPELPEEIELSEEMEIELSRWKLIAADCREGKSGRIHPLHVPKEGYAIHQNNLLFETMIAAAKEVLGESGFQIATIGTLGSYSQFFISLAINGQTDFETGNLQGGQKDRWKRFFNLYSSHNSVMPSQIMASVVRIVCMNTVRASIADADGTGQNLKFRHSKNSVELITPENFADALEDWQNETARFEEVMRAIQGQPMTPDQFRFFATGIFTQPSTDVLTQTSHNRVNELLELFQRGKGNSGQSEYDAFNAFTEYFTSGNGVGRNSSPAQKIAKANFGQGANWKEKAAYVLANREEFADTMKRGERLWNDKMLIDAKKTES